jgi:flagellar motility protein MotE (MotC chaperone)
MIQDLQSQVAKLEDLARSQEEEYAALERRMDQAEADIVDLDDTAREHGVTLEALEDGLATIQEDLDPTRRTSELEQMREDVRVEIMARLRDALDSP